MIVYRNLLLTLALPTLVFAGAVYAQTTPVQSPNWGVEFYGRYGIRPNITYLTASGHANTLDVWTRRDVQGPQPTVIFIHGGGWTGGTKEAGIGFLLPYIAMGWNAVNVDYRVARVANAPAAVEDCLCVLRWIAANAQRYQIDVNRLVLTGDSAGGHLSLTTGMIPANSAVDALCPGPPLPKVAAVVDFYGITDVNDLLDGPNKQTYAVQWLGDVPNREEVAKHASPLEYVRAGLPPIMIIHGDADPTVPYQHSVRLKAALDKAGVPNEFYTVPGGHHGGFTAAEYVPVYGAIMKFLKKQGLPVP
jgi:acetyl esterase/lipase